MILNEIFRSKIWFSKICTSKICHAIARGSRDHVKYQQSCMKVCNMLTTNLLYQYSRHFPEHDYDELEDEDPGSEVDEGDDLEQDDADIEDDGRDGTGALTIQDLLNYLGKQSQHIHLPITHARSVGQEEPEDNNPINFDTTLPSTYLTIECWCS